MAFELPVTAFRHAPWGGINGSADIVRLAADWSGATFVWAFADGPGGTHLFELTAAAEGSQGISSSYDSGYIHPTSGAIVGATTIRPQIDEATLSGLDDPDPVSDDIELYHTLYVTLPGENKRVFCYGIFTIKQGAPTS